MRNTYIFKKIAFFLSNTAFHPQWLMRSSQFNLHNILSNVSRGNLVLDIGCSNKWAKNYIPPNCYYIGLDYLFSADNWYKSTPDIYANGLFLPVKNKSIDTVLLLDVLEHIENTEALLNEVYRVLKPNGKAVIQIPFLYQIHDAPLDFVRLTRFGVDYYCKKLNYELNHCSSIGTPIETSKLTDNLALSALFIDFFSRRSLFSIGIVLLPFLFLKNNMIAYIFKFFYKNNISMPYRYQIILQKPS